MKRLSAAHRNEGGISTKSTIMWIMTPHLPNLSPSDEYPAEIPFPKELPLEKKLVQKKCARIKLTFCRCEKCDIVWRSNVNQWFSIVIIETIVAQQLMGTRSYY